MTHNSGVHLHPSMKDNVSTVHQQVSIHWYRSVDSDDLVSCSDSLSNNSCSFSTLNLTMCNPTQARPVNQNQFFASSCGLETILSMSPIIGTVGTYLNFTGKSSDFFFSSLSYLLYESIFSGDYFDGSPCEYDIEIGSFYRCPVTNVTSTTLTCRIDNTTRLFSQPISHLVRIHRLGRGYLKSYNELRFSFQTAITQISPTTGNIALSITAASQAFFS